MQRWLGRQLEGHGSFPNIFRLNYALEAMSLTL